MSRVGQASLAGSSTPQAAQRLACTASASPAASTAGGKVTKATGPGAGGQGAGLGGGGPRGVRSLLCLQGFPQQWLLGSFLLLLGSARRRLSLPLPPSSPPALPRPPGPSAGEAGEAGPGTHTHSHWHTQTHAAPACSFLSPFLSLLPPSPPRSLSEPHAEGGPRAGGGWSCPAGPASSPPARRKSGGRERGGTAEKNKRD